MDVRSVKVLHTSKFLLFNESLYADKKLFMRSWSWVERTGNASAVMVAALHGDNLVVIREFRVPINGYIWSLPAGLVELGASVKETVDKETLEETGLTITEYIRPISYFTRTSPGLTNERLTYAFVRVEGTPSNKHLESSEDIEVHLMSRYQVSEILKSGDEIDSKAYLIMLRFVEEGKI